MQLHTPLSPTARPFQPGAALSSTLVDDTPRDHPARDGIRRSSPPQGSTRGLPVREATPNHHNTSDDDGVSTDTSIPESPLAGGVGAEEVKVAGVVVNPMELTPLEGGERKRMDYSSKIQIPEFGDKKGHPHDVANAFRQWARCITYYHYYYED